MAIQTGLQKYGYKGRARSTFAISENNVILEDKPTMAYVSMDDRVELQYGGKRVDFLYRYAAPRYKPEMIKKAVQSLTNRGKLGDIKDLAEVIFNILDQKMSSDKPTLEQLKSMSVHRG